MPNWVTNTLLMTEGNKDKLAPFINPEEEFDLNLVVPTPEGEEYEKNWYEWNCQHWGTKWNANSTTQWIDDDSVPIHGISFLTAWSPPTPILERLHKLGIEFMHYYFDEGHCFWGVTPYTDDKDHYAYMEESVSSADNYHAIYQRSYGVSMHSELLNDPVAALGHVIDMLGGFIESYKANNKIPSNETRYAPHEIHEFVSGLTDELEMLRQELTKLTAVSWDYDDHDKLVSDLDKLDSVFNRINTATTEPELAVKFVNSMEITLLRLVSMRRAAYVDDVDIRPWLINISGVVVPVGFSPYTNDTKQVRDLINDSQLDRTKWLLALSRIINSYECGFTKIADTMLKGCKVYDSTHTKAYFNRDQKCVLQLSALLSIISNYIDNEQVPNEPADKLEVLLVQLFYLYARAASINRVNATEYEMLTHVVSRVKMLSEKIKMLLMLGNGLPERKEGASMFSYVTNSIDGRYWY